MSQAVSSAVTAAIVVAVALSVGIYLARRARHASRRPGLEDTRDPDEGSWYFVRYDPRSSEGERDEGAA